MQTEILVNFALMKGDEYWNSKKKKNEEKADERTNQLNKHRGDSAILIFNVT